MGKEREKEEKKKKPITNHLIEIPHRHFVIIYLFWSKEWTAV